MAYARELDDLRQELRQSVAGTVSMWAKVNGVNVAAHTTASNNTFTVYDTVGAVIEGPTNATDTLVGGVSRLDASVSAIGTLGEDYFVKFLWQETGQSVQYHDVVYFDVVLHPFGPPSVSLNDMQELRPDIGEMLTRQGTVLALTNPAEDMAGVYAVRARVELDSLIRNAVAVDFKNSEGQPGTTGTASRYTRPNLILNRERLRRVEVLLACTLAYQGDMTGPEEDDEASSLWKHFKALADTAWLSVGPLKYDAAEDLVPDQVIEDIGRVTRLTRVQS